MSRLLGNERELREAVGSGGDAYVLFYAEWCPFCLRFLPRFEALGDNGGGNFFRIRLAGNTPLFDEFGVEIYPTVLRFRSGQVTGRLDGARGRGLSEGRLRQFVGR